MGSWHNLLSRRNSGSFNRVILGVFFGFFASTHFIILESLVALALFDARFFGVRGFHLFIFLQLLGLLRARWHTFLLTARRFLFFVLVSATFFFGSIGGVYRSFGLGVLCLFGSLLLELLLDQFLFFFALFLVLLWVGGNN